MKHYLISVRLTSPPKTHFHSYLMCEDDKFVEQGCSKMSSLCEENGVEIFPAFMVTALDADGIKLVRAVVSAESRRVKEGIAAAKDFHFSAWMMPDEDPPAEGLLALH